MQFQADILGMSVVRTTCLETTALGTTYLAGLAVDHWSSTQAIANNWRADRRFEPVMDTSQADECLAQWRHAVDRSKDWCRS